MYKIETPMDVINISPSTKTEAADFAQRLIALVNNGEENPLAMAVKINAIIKSLESVRTAINDQILTEAERYSAKTFEAHGAEITIQELGTKYSYDKCGDKDWEARNELATRAADGRKEREEFLKHLKEPLDSYDPDTGETYKIYPPQKKSTTGIKISLK